MSVCACHLQDHNFVQPSGKTSVRDVGIMLFRERVIKHPSVRARVKSVSHAVVRLLFFV